MVRHAAVRIPLGLGYGAIAVVVAFVASLVLLLALGVIPARTALTASERLGFLLLGPCFLLWGVVWGVGAWRLLRPGAPPRWLRPIAWTLIAVEAAQWAIAVTMPRLNPQDAAAISVFTIGGTLLLLLMLERWRRPAPGAGAT